MESALFVGISDETSRFFYGKTCASLEVEVLDTSRVFDFKDCTSLVVDALEVSRFLAVIEIS